MNSTAEGQGAIASGKNSKADGQAAAATGDNSTALGQGSTASGVNTTAVGQGSMASAPNSVAIGTGSVASAPNTVSFGSPGNERRLTNVAPGINGTDAVNMNQLWGVQSTVNEVARRAYSGVAAATALTMIPEVDPGKTIAVGIGGGSYQGYSASAIGVSVRFSDNLKAKLGVGISGNGSTYGGGVSYQW
ncbi:YadA family autotransporter adhesin [Burkholderia territorii]|uniref:YadA family autotransporter adhesin n=1 Tax=Burkholderia territorii TaxID=1503055 RepID=UPI0039BEEE30